MTFTTNRLYFKELSTDDIQNIHELHRLPETDRFNTLGIPGSVVETKKIVGEWLIAQNATPRISYIFCLHLLHSKQFIGLIALNIGKPKYHKAEVWYKVHSAFWNHGYTTEALNKLLDVGFNDLALHRIEAGCAVENIASIKVLEKAGMTREGMKRKVLPIRGEWKDNFFYAILVEDFNANKL